MRIFSIKYFLSLLIFLSGNALYGVTASFSASTGSASENAGGSVTINFDAAAYGNVTFTVGVGTATNYGSGYHDFNLNSNTIGLSGETSYDIDLNVTNDNRYEADETVIITLTSGAGITIGSPNTVTFTIENDDDPPTLKFQNSTSNEEEGETNYIRVDVDQAGTDVGLTATIDWAITNGTTANEDHATDLSGTLTFIQGNTVKYIEYRADQDQMDEND